MKIEKGLDGTYFATKTHRDGTICMGYSRNFADAAIYCFESLADEDRKSNAKKCKLRAVK